MKPKILCFIDWFLPGYKAGGQIQSLANAIDCLHIDYDFYVVTRNTDLDGKQKYPVAFEQWTSVCSARIYYVDGQLDMKKIGNLLTDVKPDIVYFSSFFSLQYTVLPLIYLKLHSCKARCIVGPRGMLGEGALQLKSYKKKIFIAVAKIFGLYKRVIWHASTEIEKNDIIQIFGSNQEIRVACDIPKQVLPIDISKKIKEAGVVRFVFLSRISRKKNLLFALNLLTDISSSVEFEIIGPVEDEDYWSECKAVITNLPKNVAVRYSGSLAANEVVMHIAQNAHFFILPTLHENFGHVIIEAFSAACPVLISDQTPWRDLEQLEIGWDIALDDIPRWQEVLLNCCLMNNKQYQEMSLKAFEFAKAFSSNPKIIEENKRLFAF